MIHQNRTLIPIYYVKFTFLMGNFWDLKLLLNLTGPQKLIKLVGKIAEN